MEQVLYKLPDGWVWHSVKKLSHNIQYGHTAKAESNGNAKFLRITDIQDGKINWQGVPTVSLEEKEISKYALNDDDLIFARSGATAGKSILIKNAPKDAVFASYLIRIVPNKKDIIPEYLSYFFLTPAYWEVVGQNAAGAAQPNINGTKLSEFIVPVAPQCEQKRIVEKLDTLLTRIDTAIEHLQESVTLKNSLLQSALDGQFSAITDRMTIESLAEVKGGKRLPKGEKLSDEETEHPYIRVADFTDKGTIDLSGIKYVSKEIHKQIKRYVISKDDLYISIAGTIGKTGFVPPELDGANLTENAAKLVIRDKQQLDLSYLYLFTLTSDFSAQAGLATKKVAQPKLALTRLSKIEIPMCSLEEQKALVSTIETLKSKIHDAEEALLGKIEDLKSLKASILDSAFKGEL
ncbi:restriction endonuclease subunit S [Vibrio parahaemolyticus]|uniref:restriction endonuclease subunit S n=1 Tax=Vibrio parahaemolyticus TaxID=670 RepID=UPI00100ECCBA|nr:restriction endonuclease subunit S [Vibrio parahaemolyticus]RXP53191.1 restriction endonuclease subunit S [Vibrio parahaemolyticus]RXP53868.1 restriction endonuclease subunit S [Vibrio parahaemolyticus]RXP66069.1 restriction endonuclease subunit S [Vibrio parahaemolyticus]RXP66493.1 restriction endonuclease subunit S [Vibrio parahaemolyticus]RXP91549.1 restriction endonuclease subunit S [Vibrio parahaemolyticus]